MAYFTTNTTITERKGVYGHKQTDLVACQIWPGSNFSHLPYLPSLLSLIRHFPFPFPFDSIVKLYFLETRDYNSHFDASHVAIAHQMEKMQQVKRGTVTVCA